MKEQAADAVRPVVEWLQTQGLVLGSRVISALLILMVGALVIKGISAFLRHALEQRVTGENEMLIKFVVSVAVKTCWAFLFVVVLGRLGVEVGPLIAGLGATGLIIGFAFQESLGSLAAGIMLALNKPFKVGDFVTVAGFEGTVKALDMMAVTLATGDNRRVTIPNKSAWGSPIVNYTALGMRRVDLLFSVAYGTDLAAARALVLATVSKVPGALADPAPVSMVSALDESSIKIGARAWCRSGDYWAVYNGAVEAVNNAFVAAAALAACGCIQVKTESEIKPIHITMDVNLKVDKDLDKAFADEDQKKPKGNFKAVKEMVDRQAAGLTRLALLEAREGATDDDRLLIAEENASRMKRFSAVAKSNGTTLEAVQKRYAAKSRERLPNGCWYETDDGRWTRK